MKHNCHAIECGRAVPASKLMCLAHWRMVPRAEQQAIWQHYRRGQERDQKPSGAYMIAFWSAVATVAVAEGKHEAAALCRQRAARWAAREARP